MVDTIINHYNAAKCFFNCTRSFFNKTKYKLMMTIIIAYSIHSLFRRKCIKDIKRLCYLAFIWHWQHTLFGMWTAMNDQVLYSPRAVVFSWWCRPLHVVASLCARTHFGAVMTRFRSPIQRPTLVGVRFTQVSRFGDEYIFWWRFWMRIVWN